MSSGTTRGGAGARRRAAAAVAMVVALLGVSSGPAHAAATFTSATDVVVGSLSFSVAVGDFNGDAKADLAVANFNSNTVSIRMNQDTTAATPPTCKIRAVIAGPPRQLVVDASDLRSGVKAIRVTMLENATARIEPFAALGRFSPEVLVVFTKVDQTALARVAFTVTDGAGQQRLCT